MSMQHKAFLFNTEVYYEQIEPIIESCCKTSDSGVVCEYINNNLEQIYNPYTTENLEVDWQNELESGSMQELFDFILTRCYEPDDDIGLEYSWDGVLEAIKEMNILDEAEADICVLGRPLIYAGVEINPGLMGLGIVEAGEVKRIKDILTKNQKKLETIDIPEDLLYELDEDELIDAYDDLCSIYKRAEAEGKGLLFTF